eukprot:TRINITY_DN5950_c0_g1::TRINITY_DN5950_c0_g1_i1::g.9952::m.9952 TRINITY_DN5950_c0_g1::TRINITY_DN5950_c0_g1_i1::g.9952  ORF type:complete len:434 (+),score=78.02,sp/Q28FF3/MFS7A_XENTR/38.46/4e-92,MFS_1/PF07690.11/3.6e-31,MFS_1/PF07690.11/1.9e+03,MFS_2/PF13347.1/4.3e-07,MFS_2/PF13347.1/4.6e+02,Nodulin-like/PF06813.8/0.00011,Nodulin-like/PF06813.8/3.9,OATP/PF03137.15/19,OATP/PF03137.15/0.0023,SPC25/PF06703.6/0.063,NADH_oxidored/PF08040.6/15,NADH_oxidored/PF08040.6/30 TRINITY_DN5950_c0_g1_i1:108-1409(
MNEDDEFILYPVRWFMLFVMCLLNISNAMLWISFSPIASSTEDYYDISSTVVNLLSMAFMICYIPLGFTSCWVLDTKGLRWGVLIGASLNILGAWVRYLSSTASSKDTELGVLFLGQILAACAQPFILNAPTKLAAVWFGETERATANTIASISNPVGIAVASVLSPMIVHDPDEIPTMHLIYAVVGTVGGIFAFFFQDEPPTHPSASAGTETTDFMAGLRSALKNKQYLLLLFGFGIGLGCFNALTTLLQQIIEPHGYSEDDAGTFGAIVIGAGLVGAAIVGPLVDKTHKYKEILKVCFVVAAFAFLVFSLVLASDRDVELGIICGVMGFCCFSLLPVSLELAVETTYPVAEGTSAGLMWLMGQIFGLISIGMMDLLRDDENDDDMTNATYFMSGLAFVGAGAILFFNSNYKRLEAEKEVHDAYRLMNDSAS